MHFNPLNSHFIPKVGNYLLELLLQVFWVEGGIYKPWLLRLFYIRPFVLIKFFAVFFLYVYIFWIVDQLGYRLLLVNLNWTMSAIWCTGHPRTLNPNYRYNYIFHLLLMYITSKIESRFKHVSQYLRPFNHIDEVLDWGGWCKNWLKNRQSFPHP